MDNFLVHLKFVISHLKQYNKSVPKASFTMLTSE